MVSPSRGLPTFPLASPRKSDFLFADGKIAGSDYLGDDVDAVLKLKIDEVRLAVLDFVKGRFLVGSALDIGEGVVVVNRRHQEGLPRTFLIQCVIELELR